MLATPTLKSRRSTVTKTTTTTSVAVPGIGTRNNSTPSTPKFIATPQLKQPQHTGIGTSTLKTSCFNSSSSSVVGDENCSQNSTPKANYSTGTPLGVSSRSAGFIPTPVLNTSKTRQQKQPEHLPKQEQCAKDPLPTYLSKPDGVDTPTWTMFLKTAYPEESLTLSLNMDQLSLNDANTAAASTEVTPTTKSVKKQQPAANGKLKKGQNVTRRARNVSVESPVMNLVATPKLKQTTRPSSHSVSLIKTPQIKMKPLATNVEFVENKDETKGLMSLRDGSVKSPELPSSLTSQDPLEFAMRRLSLTRNDKKQSHRRRSNGGGVAKPSSSSATSHSLLNSPTAWQRNKSHGFNTTSTGTSSKVISKASCGGSGATIHVDRFIASRTDLASSQFHLTRTLQSSTSLPASTSGHDASSTTDLTTSSSTSSSVSASTGSFTQTLDLKSLEPSDLTYQKEVARACGVALDQRILSFKTKNSSLLATASSGLAGRAEREDLRQKYNRPLRSSSNTTHARRKIATVPERVLDAPGILDDYYSNLLDWSSQNMLAVSLGPSVYVWKGSTGETFELFTTASEADLTSVSWSPDGSYLAAGDATGQTHIIHMERMRRVRSLKTPLSHMQPDDEGGWLEPRIESLAWNKGILCTGNSQGLVHHHDVRVPHSIQAVSRGHSSNVCGLKWSFDGTQLASGGNDNLVNIWDARASQRPKFTMSEHSGAVKALAWCPW